MKLFLFVVSLASLPATRVPACPPAAGEPDKLEPLSTVSRDPLTKFIPMKHVDLDLAVAFVVKQIGVSKTFQAIPDPRTQRVFMMGTVAELALGEKSLRQLDDDTTDKSSQVRE